MNNAAIEQYIQKIVDKAPCTPLAAQLLVTGLQLAMERNRLSAKRPNHVTARELCSSILELAQDYGQSSIATLKIAGIERSEDIGRIIFSLIEQGLLSKQDGESIDDFVGLIP